MREREHRTQRWTGIKESAPGERRELILPVCLTESTVAVSMLRMRKRMGNKLDMMTNQYPFPACSVSEENRE